MNDTLPQERRAPVLTGSCGCGRVRFEVFEPLVTAVYCHCTHCQKHAGTAYQATAWAASGSIEVTAGAEHLREWTATTNAKVFCGVCASPLLSRVPSGGEYRAVRMAAIDGDPGVRPVAHQFVADAAPWAPIPEDGLPRFEGRWPRPG
jgi:hypothetical protein